MIHEGSIHLTFTYAAGPATSAFLAALQDRAEILGARCPGCDLVVTPARSFCPRCGERTGDLVPVGPEGVLVARTFDPVRGGFGLIRLDGAGTDMLHRLLGEPSSWRHSARLRPRFAAERRGSITDIDGFEPTEATP
ncbi:MAG: zinc ribbon domain-containing protein [Acidimicrobiia bacterium]|nr:MAG: zinc ribbon domain-containing protein [Acidimicrobiia bacterium]